MKRFSLLLLISILFLHSCQKEIQIPVSSLSISPASLDFMEGDAPKQLVATVTPENATDAVVTWSSLNSNVAEVNSKGLVTPISIGSVTITASAGGKTASCSVRVCADIALKDIRISPGSVYLNVGETHTLSVEAVPLTAPTGPVRWNSEDTYVATVTDDGIVTAVNPGKCHVTATVGSLEARCIVVVSDVESTDSVSDIYLNKSSLELQEGDSYNLRVCHSSDSTVIWNANPSFSSSDESVATVNQEGLVRAVGAGECIISAELDGNVANCSVTVLKTDLFYVEFPDPAFRKYMIENFDLDNDGRLSSVEARSIGAIQCAKKGIKSLDGIENCANLVYLDCQNNDITRIDLSSLDQVSIIDFQGNRHLEYIDYGDNQFLNLPSSIGSLYHDLESESLEIIGINVKYITIQRSPNIRHLVIGSCPSLLRLIIEGTTKIDTYEMPPFENLELASIFGPTLESIIIHDSPSLKGLSVGGDNLTNVDIYSDLPLLESLYVRGGRMNDMDYNRFRSLKSLSIHCDLNNLDVSMLDSLECLECDKCNLRILDISHNPLVKYCYFSGNKHLEEINFGDAKITSFYSPGKPEHKTCDLNDIVSPKIKISGTYLDSLTVSNKDLEVLDLSACPNLLKLYVNSKNFKALDIHGSKLLRNLSLSVESNSGYSLELPESNCIERLDFMRSLPYKQFDFSSFPNLTTVYCETSNADRLDFSKNQFVKSISLNSSIRTDTDCVVLMPPPNGIEQLSINGRYSFTTDKLDLSKYSQLRKASIRKAELSDIIVDGCERLEELDCSSNHVKQLSLVNLPKLRVLCCDSNCLESLDTHGLDNLVSLHCSNNSIALLDVSGNNGLRTINCSQNKILELNLGSNSNLEAIDCGQNPLEVLDVSKTQIGKVDKIGVLYCNPCESLKTLLLKTGSVLRGITYNRSTQFIPSHTTIEFVD